MASWGERAHVEAAVKSREAACLGEALHHNDVRSRMAVLLHDHPAKNVDEAELDRLARILRTLKRSGQHQDLQEAIECILAYESCYQLTQLCLERILWLCRHHSAAYITLADLAADSVLLSVRTSLPGQVHRLFDILDHGTTPGFRENLDRLSDVRRFLEFASSVTPENTAFVDAVISRHADVQHGKFDRGRRKMPWLERNSSRIQLTMTRSGGMNREATRDDFAQDLDRLIRILVLPYVDQSNSLMHDDELRAECLAKIAQILHAGHLKKCQTRGKAFGFIKIALQNHLRSLVQRHAFTEKRTGIKPPPKHRLSTSEWYDQRPTKPRCISLNDETTRIQVGGLDSGFCKAEFLEELDYVLTPEERDVLECLIQQQDRGAGEGSRDLPDKRLSLLVLNIRSKARQILRGACGHDHAVMPVTDGFLIVPNAGSSNE